MVACFYSVKAALQPDEFSPQWLLSSKLLHRAPMYSKAFH
jgi:hypothetical protein